MNTTPTMGNSQKARDLLLLAPVVVFALYLVIFWGFVFFVFGSKALDLKDAVTVGLLTTTVNQGFNLALFAAGYVYYRDTQHQRAPGRKDDFEVKSG